VSWDQISKALGKNQTTCRMHLKSLEEKATMAAWSEDMELAFKQSYQKKKGEIWKIVAMDMGYNCTWAVLENKAFELGKKGLKV